ncbi:nucleotide exchange factor GrpE [Demequina zhanjiangensis]|uniref:Protein GrpE n=1 Tax=Demequina zhanjiangensis TaxID=3051659 RepID=A0ABT8G4F7_9MICO|nr:nucleotide exchange factor GrpE [Demequina sp. SYSU T00b26]MDN4474025.1 nucleotide exchange factor GrpE [Demequina sp. SYSU T00b26]
MTDENKNPESEDPLAQAERILNDAAESVPESTFLDEDADGRDDLQADEAGADDALDAAQAKAAEHLADLQRLQAEYVNYRKRVDRDRELIATNATAKAIEALIPALDDIAAAREHGDLADGPFASIAEKLETALGRLGWSSFGAAGELFDPLHHEALMSQPSSEVTEPTIQQVAQPGHRIGDRVVRPARVIVAQPEDQQ